MKKNLMSVIILALVLANLVLTGLLIFTILPETKKANQLIEAVCAAIVLDLTSDAETEVPKIPIDQIETFKIINPEGKEKLTINFKKDSNASKNQYCIISISLSLNTESKAYKKQYPPAVLTTKMDIILEHINTIISGYTMDEFNADQDKVKQEILADMQELFGSDYIVDVNFTSVTTGE